MLEERIKASSLAVQMQYSLKGVHRSAYSDLKLKKIVHGNIGRILFGSSPGVELIKAEAQNK